MLLPGGFFCSSGSMVMLVIAPCGTLALASSVENQLNARGRLAQSAGSSIEAGWPERSGVQPVSAVPLPPAGKLARSMRISSGTFLAPDSLANCVRKPTKLVVFVPTTAVAVGS